MVIKFDYRDFEAATLKGVKIGCGRLVSGRTLCQLRTADSPEETLKKPPTVAIQDCLVLGLMDSVNLNRC